jgi:AbrB family looped-hinge helix DNA binding protein
MGKRSMSKVTAKYQITLPKRVRRDLGVVPGADVDIVKDGKRFILVVNPAEGIRRKWRGRYKDGSTTESYLDQVRGSVN